MRKQVTNSIVASLLALFIQSYVARADIFQWEYINLANPSLGKQQSTTLTPDGAGAVVGVGTNLEYRNLTKAYLIGANLGYLFGSCDEGGCDFYASYLTGANLSQADLSSAILAGAVLTDANLTDAEVRGANFYHLLFGFGDGFGGLTLAQLYSTASYKAHDLSAVNLSYNELASGNLTGQNLSNANFFAANLLNANLSAADARGANFQFATLTGATTTNLIQTNGHIAELDLTTGATLLIRDYDGNPAASPPVGPLPIVVDQNLAMSGSGSLKLVFEQDAWNSTISFAPGIPVARGGRLELTFAPDVSLATQIGRTIDLFDWNGVLPTGTFNVSSPYTWDISKLYTTGEVTLTAAPGIVPGDFNGNGTVDAADYVVWRKGISVAPTQENYNSWRSRFGQPGGSGAGATDYTSPSAESLPTAVPEPASLLLLSMVGLALAMTRPIRANQVTIRAILRITYVSTAIALTCSAAASHADIFQWEYINPANPSLGKQPSTTLAPQGAGVDALPGANLFGRNLTKAYLIGADLSPLYDFEGWTPADLRNANLSQADLAGANLRDSYLGNANFSQANLTSTYMGNAYLVGAILTGAEVRWANFQYADLSQSQLYSTASYANHDLMGISLSGARLPGINLAAQNLNSASLFGATLSGANLSQANLTAAQLGAIDARGANFSQANLTYANLVGADLRGANMLGATLTGVYSFNWIQSNGHIASLNLTANAGLTGLSVRDYDGNPTASPPTGPLPIVVDQRFVSDTSSGLVMKFDADFWDSTISFAPGIPVSRGGTLWLTFEPGVNLAGQIGRTIDLFDWTGVSPTGIFTVYSDDDYTWDLSKLYTTGEVKLVSVPGIRPGDFNYDGIVNAADYVVWRKTDGSDVGYNAWRANFGTTLGSGSSQFADLPLSSAIPEPTSALLCLSFAAIGVWVHRRGFHRQ